MPKRQQEYVPTLPNPGSKGQTAASLAMDVYYTNLLLVERWTWERFVRLANLLKFTPHEMASFVLLPHKCLDRYASKNGLPMTLPHARAVAMILTLVEAHVAGHLTKDVIENPFPKL